MTQSKWHNRFIDLTSHIATWSSCLRRQVGAIIVQDNRVISTGYNGAPKGIESCVECGQCRKESFQCGTNTGHDLCKAVHAEANAIAQASRYGISTNGATLYCNYSPCSMCAKLIINAGIAKVYYENEYPDRFAMELLDEADVICEKIISENKRNNE